MQRDTCIHSSMLTVSWIWNFVHMHQHKLMYALFLCPSHSENKGPLWSISDTDFLSNVLFCQSDQNDLYKFGFFAFHLKKDMILLGILASTPMNDREMNLLRTPVMIVETSVNWASYVSSVLTNIVSKLNSKTPSGVCLCQRTFWK